MGLKQVPSNLQYLARQGQSPLRSRFNKRCLSERFMQTSATSQTYGSPRRTSSSASSHASHPRREDEPHRDGVRNEAKSIVGDSMVDSVTPDDSVSRVHVQHSQSDSEDSTEDDTTVTLTTEKQVFRSMIRSIMIEKENGPKEPEPASADPIRKVLARSTTFKEAH